MSVSDPLIKDLKGTTLRLYEQWKATNSIEDGNPDLYKFCQGLEIIFHQGLSKPGHIFTKKTTDPYIWMASIDDSANFLYKSCTEIVANSRNVTRNNLGRFRLLVRACLVKKCLNYPLEVLIKSKSTSAFYVKQSIIGDEILSEIFLSVLLQSNRINFKLDLDNVTFLDESWLIPDLLRLELVPCDNLGLGVSFAGDKAIIVDIQPNSVVSDNGKITPGDILHRLNGIRLDSSTKGRLNAIFRSNKGRPVQVQIIKAYHRQSQDIYPPLKMLLLDLHININQINKKEDFRSKLDDDVDVLSKVEGKIAFSRPGYDATYLGMVDIGNKGSVKQIERAIKTVIAENGKEKIPVTVEIGEISIKVFKLGSNDVIFKHSYMQISSCGSLSNIPNYIAYIAGEENCELASNFTCYVFHSRNLDDACTILQSIGQGFHRTHFAV